MPIFKRKIQCARRFNSRVCLYAFQIAMHYVIQFDGERRGDTKPMQKWWLKLKLPIEHEQERVYRRKAEKERQEREIRRIWNRHVFAGEKSIPIATLEIPSFRLFVDRFEKCRITQTRYRFRHDKYIIVRLRR